MSLCKALFKEPLIYFLLLAGGLIIFEKSLLDDAEQETVRIQVSADDIERIAQRWQKIYFRSPTDQELDRLIQQHIKEEVFYREATKMGLGENDTAVRNRLYQKLAFLAEGLMEKQLPDDEKLRQFYVDHQDLFLSPETYSLRLNKLNTQSNKHGEMFTASMLPESLHQLSLQEIEQRLGEAVIAPIVDAPENHWVGPVPLQGGQYRVMVTDKTQLRVPEFAQIKEQLLHEYLYRQRQQAEETFYRQLKSGYHIVVDTPSS